MRVEDYFKNNKEGFKDSGQMSSGSDLSFESRLKAEIHSSTEEQKASPFKIWSIAASILLLMTFGFWYTTSNVATEEEKVLLANLENESAGKRLEGVYAFNDDYKKEDDRILDRLIDIVLNDQNANVQIASIDALMQFPKNEKVRKNLIKALEKEDKPIVQIKLIKAMRKLRDQRAQKSLEKIINNEQTFPIVKSNATMAMATLKTK
ncbi:MAG: hypothetical protein CMB99_08325 [Flavobacteriaceae bacterium]|nr:hypothetical protein [Flavobacteriaceae bacterium]|tara:strand:- start:87681 stop:88301 length:621 start_codon:yes stop_codon:yes gene_type:complete